MLQHSNICLACGLFGFIGPNPELYFNWDKFNILGWFNDSRGGDACGRVYGNNHEHGIDQLKTYKEFAMEVKNPTVPITFNTVLGHSRKASSGGKDSIYAQPIILYRKDVNMKAIKDADIKATIRTMKPEDIICSGIHNGTIDNYLELAPKYGIPTEEHNDSKVLLMALFYGNYKILAEYRGTAALVWHNHITNKTYLFKGASKYWVSSGKISEERPLYSWNVEKNNYYFSSIDDSLLFIGATKDKILDIACNVLYTFKDGVNVRRVVYDRSQAVQSKPYNDNIYSGYKRGQTWNYKTQKWEDNISGHDHFYDNEDEWRENFRGDALIAEFESRKKEKSNSAIILPSLWRPNRKDSTVLSLADGRKYIRLIASCDEPFRWQAEMSDTYNSSVIRRVVYNKSRYWMNGGLMHGIYLLNGVGLVPGRMTRDSSILHPYYFIEGVMMDGFKGYETGLQIHATFMEDLVTNTDDITTLEQQFTDDIVKYSKYPIASITNFNNPQDCYSTIVTVGKTRFYTGEFNPLFSDRHYTFDEGDLVGISLAKSGQRMGSHDSEDVQMCSLYLMQCRDDKKDDTVFCIGRQLLNLENATNPLSPFQDILFSCCDPKTDGVEMAMLFVHYIRDFISDVSDKCKLCVNEKTEILHTCISCTHFIDAVKDLTANVNYNVFNGYKSGK